MQVTLPQLSSIISGDRCNSRRLSPDGSDILTGTWLDRGKPLPGLFFLLLLLLLVPPPVLMVLPPDILRFRRLLGGCLDGSAAGEREKQRVTDAQFEITAGCAWLCVHPPGGATILCHFWKRQVLRQSLGLRLYVLCLDISSCMGSRITHSWKREQRERGNGTEINTFLRSLVMLQLVEHHYYQLVFSTNDIIGGLQILRLEKIAHKKKKKTRLCFHRTARFKRRLNVQHSDVMYK